MNSERTDHIKDDVGRTFTALNTLPVVLRYCFAKFQLLLKPENIRMALRRLIRAKRLKTRHLMCPFFAFWGYIYT